jgi:hypothetical protein
MVRLVTMNVWGMRGDWAARRAVLRDGFAALGPDEAVLQETVVRTNVDQVEEILGLSGSRTRQP